VVGDSDVGEGQFGVVADDGAGQFVASGPTGQPLAVEGDPRRLGTMAEVARVGVGDRSSDLPPGPVKREVGFGDLPVQQRDRRTDCFESELVASTATRL
jgi:hypothetical protein